MTEILDSDDARGERVSGWPPEVVREPEGDADDLLDLGPEEPREPGRWGLALRSLTDPAALAVAAVLSVLCAAASGPSYLFQAYPFNQGVGSLSSVYNFRAGAIKPLAEYLVNAAPAIGLIVVAVGCALWSLVRAGTAAASWVRPAAAGSLLVAVALGLLLVAGGYRASTLDVSPPTGTDLSTTG